MGQARLSIQRFAEIWGAQSARQRYKTACTIYRLSQNPNHNPELWKKVFDTMLAIDFYTAHNARNGSRDFPF